jgi:hypothetical protein
MDQTPRPPGLATAGEPDKNPWQVLSRLMEAIDVGTDQEYLDQAHRAARDLATAVDQLDRSPASAELRQLAADVARISGTLDRITGRTPSPGDAARPHDTDYDPGQFVDGAADLPSHHHHHRHP